MTKGGEVFFSLFLANSGFLLYGSLAHLDSIFGCSYRIVLKIKKIVDWQSAIFNFRYFQLASLLLDGFDTLIALCTGFGVHHF